RAPRAGGARLEAAAADGRSGGRDDVAAVAVLALEAEHGRGAPAAVRGRREPEAGPRVPALLVGAEDGAGEVGPLCEAVERAPFPGELRHPAEPEEGDVVLDPAGGAHHVGAPGVQRRVVAPLQAAAFLELAQLGREHPAQPPGAGPGPGAGRPAVLLDAEQERR